MGMYLRKVSALCRHLQRYDTNTRLQSKPLEVLTIRFPTTH